MFGFNLDRQSKKVLHMKIDLMEEQVREVRGYFNKMYDELGTQQRAMTEAYSRLNRKILALEKITLSGRYAPPAKKLNPTLSNQTMESLLKIQGCINIDSIVEEMKNDN